MSCLQTENIAARTLTTAGETAKKIAELIAAGTLTTAEAIARQLIEERAELTIEEAREMANEIIALMKAGFLSAEELATEIAKLMAATNTPRFRGVTYTAGRNEDNGHLDDGKQMNLNDWVFFAKGGSGDWIENHVYQWTIDGWRMCPLPSSGDTSCGWMYLDAVSSSHGITDGVEDIGIFSDVFCKALTAAAIFVERLFAREIILRCNNDNPNRKIVGSIQSEHYDPIEKTGFRMDAEGKITIYNGTIEIGGNTPIGINDK